MPGGAERWSHSRPSQEEIEQARAKAERRGADGHARSPNRCICASLRPACRAAAIDELKQAIEDFPGPAEVLLDIDTSTGTRRLRLGEAYRVQHTSTLRAELEHALAPLVAASATG